jgi:hypothetical protein
MRKFGQEISIGRNDLADKISTFTAGHLRRGLNLRGKWKREKLKKLTQAFGLHKEIENILSIYLAPVTYYYYYYHH